MTKRLAWLWDSEGVSLCGAVLAAERTLASPPSSELKTPPSSRTPDPLVFNAQVSQRSKFLQCESNPFVIMLTCLCNPCHWLTLHARLPDALVCCFWHGFEVPDSSFHTLPMSTPSPAFVVGAQGGDASAAVGGRDAGQLEVWGANAVVGIDLHAHTSLSQGRPWKYLIGPMAVPNESMVLRSTVLVWRVSDQLTKNTTCIYAFPWSGKEGPHSRLDKAFYFMQH